MVVADRFSASVGCPLWPKAQIALEPSTTTTARLVIIQRIKKAPGADFGYQHCPFFRVHAGAAWMLGAHSASFLTLKQPERFPRHSPPALGVARSRAAHDSRPAKNHGQDRDNRVAVNRGHNSLAQSKKDTSAILLGLPAPEDQKTIESVVMTPERAAKS